MDDTLLSWYQALQLLALGPCLFMVFFLSVAGREIRQVCVPLLYFLSLACSFLLPLRTLLALEDNMHAILLMGASAAPAISFLLIVQFMTGRLPKPIYWSILAVPLIGGSQIIYATVVTDREVCIYEHLCTQPLMFRKLYDIFSISLTCLLTLLIYRRIKKPSLEIKASIEVRQEYALVLALVLLNLALLGIDLMQIAGYTDINHVRFAKTFVRIGFIYLVLTSVFRVFDRVVEIDYTRVPIMKSSGPSERDLTLAARLRAMLTNDKLYHDMDLGREKLAKMLAVNEGTLSRVVNQCFNENVSMVINRYRIEEAKLRLASETTSITAIAFEVGFSSIPSFNRVFKQLTNMSPTEWRQRKASL
jgi:AraC-like DNA-binding protein